MAKTKTGRPPAMNRRFVLYDLNEQEGDLVRKLAEAEGRTLSRWIADCIRREIKHRAAEAQR